MEKTEIDLILEEKKFLSVVNEIVGDKKKLTDEELKKILIAHQLYTEKIILKGYQDFVKNYGKSIYNHKTNEEIILIEY